MKIRNARKKTKAFKQVFIKASFALAVDAIILFYMLWRLKKMTWDICHKYRQFPIIPHID